MQANKNSVASHGTGNIQPQELQKQML